MKRWILVVVALVIAALVTVWFVANPRGRFGWSTSMLTTYNRAPLPFVDLQVRGDGAMRVVGKSHEVDEARLAWLLDPRPDVLIIAVGWRADVRIKGPLARFGQTKLLVLPTGKALKVFNSLREKGVRVAIHVHSTD